MVRATDAVEHGIPHVQIRVGHIDSGPENPRSVRKLTGPHPLEKIPALRRGTIPVGTFPPGFGEGAAGPPDFLPVEFADVGTPLIDQGERPLEELLEVIGGEALPVPLEPEPADVRADRLDELVALALRIGVVEAQVAAPAELGGDPEVQADRFGVPEVEVAVGLGGEPGDHSVGILPRVQIVGDDAPDKIPSFRLAHDRAPPVAASCSRRPTASSIPSRSMIAPRSGPASEPVSANRATGR